MLYQHRMGTEFGDPIEGLSLPTLRPFDIPHPIGIPVALSNTRLYTTNDQDDLWAATLTLP